MTRPLMERTAAEAAQGAGIPLPAILAALELLVPLLQLCAGDDPAGWLAGKGALVPAWAARRRERMVRTRLADHGVKGLVADRLVERLRAAKPLEVKLLYAEADRR